MERTEEPKKTKRAGFSPWLIVVGLALAVFGVSLLLDVWLLGHIDWRMTIWATWMATLLTGCIVHSNSRKRQGKGQKFGDDIIFNIAMIILALGALVFWFLAPSVL